MRAPIRFSFLNESNVSWPTGKVPIETLLRARHGASRAKGGLNTPCLKKLLLAIRKLQPGSKPSAEVIRETFVTYFKECCDAFAVPIWSESELQQFGVTTPALMSRQLMREYHRKPSSIGPRDWLRTTVNPATGKLLSAASHPAAGTRPLTRQRLRATPNSSPFRTHVFQSHPIDLIPEMQSTWLTLLTDGPIAFTDWWNAPEEQM